jgi:spore maturation protein CgeB
MNSFELVLFEAQSGALSAKLEHSDGSTLHLHSLVDPEAEGRHFYDLTIWGEIIVLEGTGLGYHLNLALKGINKNVTLIILEYYKKCADRCAASLQELYGVEPVIITSETKNREQIFKEHLDKGRLIQVIKHPASYKANQKFYDLMFHSVTWSTAHSGQSKNTVLFSGKFFLQRELNNAVVTAGERCTALKYEMLKSPVAYEKEVQYIVQSGKPDLFISVNMLGFDGNGIFSEYTYRYGIPVAVWFVDDPRPILMSQKEHIRDNMTAFCWERDYIESLRTAGFSNVHYLPLATDPELFSGTVLSNKKIPLAFTGTSMAGTFRSSLRNKFMWKQEFEPFVYEIAEQLIASPSLDVASLIQRYPNTGKVHFSDKRNNVWLHSYIIHTAGMLKRKRIIESMRSFSIEIFGDRDGWSELVGNEYTVHPPVDYTTKLQEVYNTVNVNLNITSCQMTSAVNQRVFDVPVSGNFLITDYQKDLDELFEPDEIVKYHTTDELIELYNHFSGDESSRKKITQKARQRILNEHTYVNRYLSMRQKIFS